MRVLVIPHVGPHYQIEFLRESKMRVFVGLLIVEVLLQGIAALMTGFGTSNQSVRGNHSAAINGR
jgi:hypothetical protein